MDFTNTRFKFIFGDDKVIYAVKATGELLWYQDTLRNGTNVIPVGNDEILTGWAPNSGHHIGLNWDEFMQVFSGGDGIIYAIKPTGELLWYQDTRRDGTNGMMGTSGWAPNSGNQIGPGWDQFMHVFSGSNGIIYAVTSTGDLLWYRDMFRNGTNGIMGTSGWAPNSGNKIGFGWDQFTYVFSGGDGIIYAIKTTGELVWYQDTLQDGSNGATGERGWAPGSGNQIGIGWDQFVHVFAAGDGMIYAIKINNYGGQLHWYLDILRNGTNGPHGERGWSDKSGGLANRGWQIAGIEGYCWPLSAMSGETVNFFVSTILEQPYKVTYVKLKELPDKTYGVPIDSTFIVEGSYQSSSDISWRDGCNWQASFQLLISDVWTSGLYAAKCETIDHSFYYIVFIVKPKSTEIKDFLVLANTNTWNASC